MRYFALCVLTVVLAGCGETPERASAPTAAEVAAAAEEVAPEKKAVNLPEGTKEARCVVTSGGEKTDIPCAFGQDRSGSFAISSLDGSDLAEGVMMISVTIIEPGEAEVRGLTHAGINSRWGAASRSSDDPACWVGSDFEVCAY